KFHRPGEAPLIKVYGATVEEQPVTTAATNNLFCQIFVEDNGIGFDEKHLNRIFQPFQRLHGLNEYEGTGMGLAICQRIVERHRGRIMARSILGQGATFIIILPVRQVNGGDGS
ncbi:MAG: ATP-binding protein, partial [Chloroflexi bacterium]|nr:ATP-binding protein [Chloroflexota bacterium]